MKELKIIRDDNTGLVIAWKKSSNATKYIILGKNKMFNDEVIDSTTETMISLEQKKLQNYIGVTVESVVEDHKTHEQIILDRTKTYLRKEEKDYEEIKVKAMESYRGITLSYASNTIYDRYFIYEKEKNKYRKILETEDFQVNSKLFKVGNTYKIEGYKIDQNGNYQLECKSNDYKLSLEEYKPSAKEPKVSVIIPTYNCETLLPRAIDSVLLSSLKEIELIIINDGSTDKTKEIIDWYKKRYKSVIIDETTKNQGTAKARNYGLSFATAPYTYFMDHDDFIHPKMLEVMVNCALETDSDFVMNKDIVRDDIDNTVIFYSYIDDKDNEKRYITKNYEEFIMNRHNCSDENFYLVTLWQHIAKTKIYKEHPMPDFEKYEDIAYVRELFSYGDKFSFHMDAYYVWDKRIKNIGGSSTTRTDKKLSGDEKAKLYTDAIFHFTKNGQKEKFDLMMYDALCDMFDYCEGTLKSILKGKAKYNRDNIYLEETYKYIMEYEAYFNPYVEKDKRINAMVKGIMIVMNEAKEKESD